MQFTVHDSLVGGVASLGARAAWVDAASGGVAAAAAAVVTQPLDVIKTRQMAARRGAEGGLVLTGTAILREEGARALFLGTAPRVALVNTCGAAPLGGPRDAGARGFYSPGAYCTNPPFRQDTPGPCPQKTRKSSD